jgi:hypothetical protein
MSDGESHYRKMKQKYLKEQILDQKWDGHEFSNFLLSQREDGTNIDNWDFDELIAQVEQFKRVKKTKIRKLKSRARASKISKSGHLKQNRAIPARSE